MPTCYGYRAAWARTGHYLRSQVSFYRGGLNRFAMNYSRCQVSRHERCARVLAEEKGNKMQKVIAALLCAAGIAMAGVSGVFPVYATHVSETNYPRVSDFPPWTPATAPHALFDKQRVWASVMRDIEVGGMIRVYYSVQWDPFLSAYREFIGFHYRDPSRNIFFVRPLGGRVDMRMLDKKVEKNIFDSAADRLFDEVKTYLDVDGFIRGFIDIHKPAAWPRTWPPRP